MVPEPFSIVAGATGLISFIVTIRNSIQVVHDDVDTYIHFKTYLASLLARMIEQRKKIDDWKRQWMVWDQEDDELLLKHLWGDDGWAEIFECLKRTTGICNRAEKNLKNLSKPGGLLTRNRQRIAFITMKKGAIRTFMDDIDRETKFLNDKADRYFKHKHRNVQPREESIHELGNGFNLIRLAIATWKASDDLLESCEKANTRLLMDLELDFFGLNVDNMLLRSQSISASAARSQLNFGFLAKKQQQDIPAIRTLLQNQENGAGNAHVALTPAFEDVLKPAITESAFQPPVSTRFRVRKLEGNGRIGPGTPNINGYSESNSFREILSDPTTHNLHEFYFVKEDRRKIKLALQLVECGLLFLGSRWLDKLCSCKLRRRGSEHYGYEFLLRGATQEHIPPQWESLEDPQCYCWCEVGFLGVFGDLNLRYLGILLTEIAIGRPIYNAVTYPAGPRTTGVVNLEYMPGLGSESIEETKRKVHKASTATYADVVEFCLTSAWSRSSFRESSQNNAEDRIKIRLAQYYTNVLTP